MPGAARRFGISPEDPAPDYQRQRDPLHACAVPWTGSADDRLWRCAECGRWWKRIWELAAGQPPVDEELLLRRAGIGPGTAIALHQFKIKSSTGRGLDYLIWTPDGEPEQSGWPLIIFLHGGAETGGHPSNAARGGLPKQIEQGYAPPFVVVAPHCPNPPHPNRNSWAEFPAEVAAVVAEVRARHPINANAILLTGPSMGGSGTWDLAARCPGTFTAAAPVCGGGNPLLAAELARIPICAFHGVEDTIVPVETTLAMAEAVGAAGGRIRTVIFPEVGHVDASERAYAPDSELYPWFASTVHVP
ncbi:dienelactone hydrolase family protein [Microlunatus sp. GCM10028923]|uniref:carboxylesterase family protein n=1 Tax=Microlunatus sp. GCM10028923 TaxID=3273400 RepID=UPI0036084326